MANNIDSVKKIQKEIDSIISQMKTAQTRLIDISKLARNTADSFSRIKIPDDVNNTLRESRDNTEQLNAVIKEQNSLERLLISTMAKLTLQEESTARAVEKHRIERNILRKEQRNQLKSVSELATSYERLNAQMNLQIREYQDLSVKQRQGIKLTDNQIKRYNQLGKSISDSQKILKDTDAEVGRFQRNVGNYAGSYDGLSNSIAQLTREAPAFAASMQTGFLALSNNIPILADEISRLNIKNKELAANGEPTKNVFKSLGAAIFSFQTLLSAGVLIITLYGDKIVEFIQKASSGGDKVRDLAKQQQILNETYKEAAKTASSEIAQLQLLIAFAGDKTKSDESRKKAVDKLIKSSGGLIKEQDRLNILNGEALEIENKLVKAILNKAVVQQLQTKISEDLNKLLDTQISLDKATEERTRTLTSEEIRNAKAKGELSKIEGSVIINRRKAGQLDEYIIELNKKKNIQQENVNNLIKSALKLIDDYTLGLDDNTKKIEKRNKAISLAIELEKERETNLKVAEETIKSLLDLYKDDSSFELPEIDQQSIEEFQQKLSEALLVDLKIKISQDTVREGLNDLANTIEEFTGVSGDKFLDFFDKITEKGEKSFEDLADIAASSFSLASDVSNSFFQGKIDKYKEDIEANNEYYANLLENEELTEEERKRLKDDRAAEEKRLKKLQDKEKAKQFQINKAFRIGEIIADTAQAIVKTGATLGYPAAIPFQIQAGVLGAAQLAIVAAQPVPKFAEGGVMDHDGYMMINDHHSGRLEVVERGNELLMTSKKNAIVEGKKGDVIHKDAKKYFDGVTDKDLISNLQYHTVMASIKSNERLVNVIENKRVKEANKFNSDQIVKAIKGQKTKVNINQSINIGEDLDFLSRLNNTL